MHFCQTTRSITKFRTLTIGNREDYEYYEYYEY